MNTDKKISYDRQGYSSKKGELQTLMDDIDAKKSEINRLEFTNSTGPSAGQMRNAQSILSDILDTMHTLVDSSISHLDKIAAGIEKVDS